MRNLKKVLALLISLILVFSLSACNDVDPDYGVSEKQETVEEETQDV